MQPGTVSSDASGTNTAALMRRCIPGKDGDLPRDVHARQIVPWVGLRIPVIGLALEVGQEL